MSEIRIKDASNLAPPQHILSWDWAMLQHCTAGMLIEERIRLEYDRVRAGAAASALFGQLSFDPDNIVQNVVDRALAAFDRGRIILLVNDAQIVGRDTPIALTGSVEAVFIQLVPLKAG